MENYYLIAIPLAILYLLVMSFFVRKWNKRNSSKWEDFANQIGLNYRPGKYSVKVDFVDFSSTLPYMEGTYRGRPVRLGFVIEKKGRQARGYYLRVDAGVVDPSGRLLGLVTGRKFSDTVKNSNAPDVKTGHRGIDKRFKVKAIPDHFAGQLFSQNSVIGDRLAEAKVNNNSIEMFGNMIYYVEEPKSSRSFGKPEDALIRLNLVCDLAEAIEQTR
ncbi:MAG: hypothetical protein HY862_09175 [Chloroflexi bacterium]|nr:hypothetical protein [Chloroflexota bacterium]